MSSSESEDPKRPDIAHGVRVGFPKELMGDLRPEVTGGGGAPQGEILIFMHRYIRVHIHGLHPLFLSLEVLK